MPTHIIVANTTAMNLMYIISLLLTACSFVMDTNTHAPLRSVVSCILSDERFRGRFVSTKDLPPLCNSLFSQLKSNAFSLAFAKSDAVSYVEVKTLVPDDFDRLGVEDGAVLAVKTNARDGNKRGKCVGVLASADEIPDVVEADMMV